MSFRHRTVPVFFAVSAEFRLIDLVRAQSGVTLFSFIYISVSAEDVGIKACEARGDSIEPKLGTLHFRQSQAFR